MTNPLELVWGDLKCGVAHDNTTFKVTDVKELVKLGMARNDQQSWCNSCNHLENTVDRIYWKNDGIQSACPRIVIKIDSDSEDTEVGDLFVLRLNVPVNNFSVMSGRSHRFLGN